MSFFYRGACMWQTVVFLGVSNIFMTYAWYGHLRDFKGKALILAIFVSWGVAFFEYCFQVPANRIGSEYFTLPQLTLFFEMAFLPLEVEAHLNWPA